MSQRIGKTHWKRFAIGAVPTVAATAAVAISMAQGALAASFSISGSAFQVSAGKLSGTGFANYATVDVAKNGKHVPVSVSSIKNATVTDMCQSVPVDIPVLGTYTMSLKASGSGTPVKAKDLYIDMTDLQAKKGTFKNVDIGVATGSMTKGQVNPKDHVDPDGYAQEADAVEITDAHQTVWATTAGTFELAGLHMSIAVSPPRLLLTTLPPPRLPRAKATGDCPGGGSVPPSSRTPSPTHDLGVLHDECRCTRTPSQ